MGILVRTYRKRSMEFLRTIYVSSTERHLEEREELARDSILNAKRQKRLLTMRISICEHRNDSRRRKRRTG
jgi:hypothetical protein